MLEDDRGVQSHEPGQVKHFKKGTVHEVENDLADAFVTHRKTAELTDEDVTPEVDPNARPARPLEHDESGAPRNGAPFQQPSVVDLAAMAASVADMLKGQFKADCDAIGERLALIEATVADLEKAMRAGVSGDEFDARLKEVGALIASNSEGLANATGELSKLRADHDALRGEFDQALEESDGEAATDQSQGDKPSTGGKGKGAK